MQVCRAYLPIYRLVPNEFQNDCIHTYRFMMCSVIGWYYSTTVEYFRSLLLRMQVCICTYSISTEPCVDNMNSCQILYLEVTKVLCPRGTVDGLTISASVIVVIARKAMAMLSSM